MKDVIVKDIDNFKCPQCNTEIYMHYGGSGTFSGSCAYCGFIFTAEPESFRVKIKDKKNEA